MNFGREQLENGTLNDMLRQVGINDVGAFVNQFRSKVNQEAAAEGNVNTASGRQATGGQQPDFVSMGSSFLNQVYLKQKVIFIISVIRIFFI
jgi:hypothetical protein